MSSNLLESNGEGSNRKRSTSPIRKYFKPSTSSPTTTTTKPLTSPNDNIMKTSTTTTTRTTKTVTNKTTSIPSKKSSQGTTSRPFLDFYQATSRKSQSTKTGSSSQSSSSSQQSLNKIEIRPGSLKRSHSAISHLDGVNETWINAPLASKQKTEAVSFFNYLFIA
jgi:hypothetical protein